MDGPHKTLTARANFKRFFVRGLAILLPSVLTVWILLAAYQFVSARIAQPINAGIKTLVVELTPWPTVNETEMAEVLADPGVRRAYNQSGQSEAWLRTQARQAKLDRWWGQYAIVLDLIGLVIAVVLIYMAGLLLGSFIGRRLYHRGEVFIHRLPLVRRVYPAVKQVTDFFVGEEREKLNFNRVVAVEYPRKGIWSIGLVTGQTMQTIETAAKHECMTIFIPSSPTPFTGYVITVPRTDTIDLPISIEDALKFVVSGGVLVPPQERIAPPGSGPGLTAGNGQAKALPSTSTTPGPTEAATPADPSAPST